MKLDILEKGVREKALGMVFDQSDRAPDDAEHICQDSKNWLAVHNLNFAERYFHFNLEIVIRVRLGSRADSEHDFIIFRDPARAILQKKWPVAGEFRSHTHTRTDDSEGAEQVMGIYAADSVQGVEEWIPSLVRLEGKHDREDVRRNVFGVSFGTRKHRFFCPSKREVVFRGAIELNARGAECRSSALIQGGPEIMHSVGCDERNSVREWLEKFNLMLLEGSIRIYLNRMGPWLVLEESVHLPFEVRDVFLCAIQP